MKKIIIYGIQSQTELVGQDRACTLYLYILHRCPRGARYLYITRPTRRKARHLLFGAKRPAEVAAHITEYTRNTQSCDSFKSHHLWGS